MARIDDALVIRDERPHAFCAGLLRPQVYVSTGAVAMLDEATLEAVLAHERHHARRRDPLRLAAGRVLARSVFFVPGLRELVSRQQALAELSADESAVSAAAGNRSALARAMLMFSDASAPDSAVGIDPARVDHLLGEPLSWRFPATLCRRGDLRDRCADRGRCIGRPGGSRVGHARSAVSLQPALCRRACVRARRNWTRGISRHQQNPEGFHRRDRHRASRACADPPDDRFRPRRLCRPRVLVPALPVHHGICSAMLRGLRRASQSA